MAGVERGQSQSVQLGKQLLPPWATGQHSRGLGTEPDPRVSALCPHHPAPCSPSAPPGRRAEAQPLPLSPATGTPGRPLPRRTGPGRRRQLRAGREGQAVSVGKQRRKSALVPPPAASCPQSGVGAGARRGGMHRGRGGRRRHPAPAAPRLGCWVAAWRRVRRSRGPAGQSVSPSVMGAGCPGRGRGASVGVEQRGTGFWGPRAAPLRLRSPRMDFRRRTMPPPGLPLTGPPRPSWALQAPPHRAAPRDGHKGHSLQSRLPALWLSCGVCTAPGRTPGASLMSAVRDDEAPPLRSPPCKDRLAGRHACPWHGGHGGTSRARAVGRRRVTGPCAPCLWARGWRLRPRHQPAARLLRAGA